MQLSSRRRGFSLVELIAAMAVSGILVGAMGVVLVTASSALERGDGPIDQERAAAEGLSEMQLDLAEATEFFEVTKTAVWFEVPDRDDDGDAEHIRYSWSGTAGDPLLRSTNGGTPGAVASDVRALDFSLVVRPGYKESVGAERLIAEFTSHAGAISGTATVTDLSRIAQIVRPSLSANASTWRASRVLLRLRQSGGADASLRVSLVNVDSSNKPGTTVYATADVKESLMSASIRIDEVAFATCQPIPAGQAVAIVIQGLTGTTAAGDVGHLSSATPTMPFNMWRAVSSNGGASWAGYGQSQNCYFQIYGTVTSVSR